ncbi:glycosyltransferase family 2 protein [Geminocystis sp. NIES-3709]|uniref:glycosyltransferase n=1 Tax=Geminocystis sp. NIES-3709 TaxID=1617448 RepID=UPI000825FC0E|nr:glycosyltransferase [Geminocystis sp. NIES-3709]
MLNKSCLFSVIIVVNNTAKNLDQLIQNIVNQCQLLGKYEIILINNLYKNKKNISIFNTVKNYQNISIIEGNFNTVYQKILKDSIGEFLIFTTTEAQPEKNWLQNIMKPFEDPQIHVVGGQIEQLKVNNIILKFYNFIKNILYKNKIKWTDIYDNQISNLAIKKEFLKRQKILNLSNLNQQKINFYYRILREVEAEITYNPSAMVYQIK